MASHDSFKSKSTLTVGDKTYTYYSLKKAAENGLGDISRLPASLKVLLENMLRNEDGKSVTKDCLLYTSPSPRDRTRSRMPSSA